MTRGALVSLVSIVGFVAASCGAPPDERVGTSRAAIIHGTDSDASQDAVVLVIHYDALDKDGSADCSGTLLTPKLVLTARHCVAVTDEGAACAADGTPLQGGAVNGDFDPTKIYVFQGAARPNFISGLAQGAQGVEVIDDGAKTFCNNDIGLLLLDHPLPNAKIAPIRLDGGPKPNEIVSLVGWGITETTTTPQTRQTRSGIGVLEIGPGTGTGDQLGPNEFRIGEGACSGDSGGPALSAAGAVIGSLSRGGNGTGATGADGCIGGQDIYETSAGFKDTILAAYAKAGQAPWLEGEPNPTLAVLGGACAADADCQSSLCDPGAKACTQDCSSAACPSGYACDDAKQCVAAAPAKSGCAESGVAPRGGLEAAILLLVIVAATKRTLRA